MGVQRRWLEAVQRALPAPAATRSSGEALGGVAGDRVEREDADPTHALLYLHGGGYTVGSPKTHRGLAAHLCSAADATVHLPDYRLAPEHPFPAALDDALAAYRGLLDSGRDPARVVLGGDSAGAGLALAAALRLRDSGGPLPAALLLICPWVDLTMSSPSVAANEGRDAVLRASWLAACAERYADGRDLRDPELSPLGADLAGLPPLVIQAAGDDLLADEADRLAERARAAGVPVEHRRFEGLWHVFQTQVGMTREADVAVEEAGRALRHRWPAKGRSAAVSSNGRPRAGTPVVAIAGSGFSGLGMAMQLKRAGIDSFEIFEREDRLGGVWRDNTYPGAACDVPSHLYSYSFEPNRAWSRRFSPQSDILEYLERCADRYRLREHLHLGTEVTRASFDEEGGRWRIETSAGDEHDADVLVTACGQLSRPAPPTIRGLDRFEGTMFHSARWEHEHDLSGERVAVVGTGASAIQFVPEIAPQVARLHVFQRSAPYVIPKMDTGYRAWQRRLFERAPLLQSAARAGWFGYFEAVIPALTGKLPSARVPLRLTHAAMLRLQVRDPELRAKLRPDYEIGCKRILVASNYYPALTRPNVEVVTDRIREVTASGIVTEDGVERPVDTIILSTGFQTNDFIAPMEVRGIGGRDLNEAWRAGAEAHLGLTVSGFPNFFVLYGPNTNLGAGSIIYMIESQFSYVLEAIRTLSRSGAAYLDVREAAQDAFSREVQRRLEASVWQTGGCNSWYRDESGRNTNNWPGFQLEYRRRTRELNLDEYRLVKASEPELAVSS